MRLSRFQTMLLGLLLAAGPAWAQSTRPDTMVPGEASRPVTVGSLELFPSIGIRDVGMDSNVYNESQRVAEDFTYTVAPGLVTVLPLGDARLVTNGRLGFTFFRTKKDQQSLNGSLSGLFDVRSGRVRPSLEASMNRSRQRSGDIDVRALGTSKAGKAAVQVGVGGITSLSGWVSREHTEFSAGEIFRNVDLGQQLNRKMSTVGGGLLLDLTPFTSVLTAVEWEQVRFATARYRDANSLKIAPTIRLAEGAIVSGSAFVGVRDFQPLQAVMPKYRGLIAGGNLRYTLLGVTRFDGSLNKDVFYSFDDLQPYFKENGGQFSVSQRIVGPLEAIALVGRRHLQYETRLDAAITGRVEKVSRWGGGVGVRLEEGVRLIFTIDREKRISTQSALRQYERTRAFASLEYEP